MYFVIMPDGYKHFSKAKNNCMKILKLQKGGANNG